MKSLQIAEGRMRPEPDANHRVNDALKPKQHDELEQTQITSIIRNFDFFLN